MEINIRKATEDDLNSILDIVNHSILYSTSNYNYEIQTIENQIVWYNNKLKFNYPIIVAECDNKVIGFGTYGMFREKIGYQYTVEHSVYVTETFIGKGIGGLLLTELIKLAKSQGIHVMIGAIDATNHSSIAFHQKYGFEVCGTIKEVAYKFDRWLDLVFMQLILNKKEI